jgi:hypothetical protein
MINLNAFCGSGSLIQKLFWFFSMQKFQVVLYIVTVAFGLLSFAVSGAKLEFQQSITRIPFAG